MKRCYHIAGNLKLQFVNKNYENSLLMYKRRDIQDENIQKNADDENFIYSYQQLKFAKFAKYARLFTMNFRHIYSDIFSYFCTTVRNIILFFSVN